MVVARSGFPFNASVHPGVSESRGPIYALEYLVPGQPFWLATAGSRRTNTNRKCFLWCLLQLPRAPRAGTTSPDLDLRKLICRPTLFFGRKLVKLQFRTDAFNILNHPNFANPAGYIQFGPLYFQSQQMLNQALGGLNPLFQEGGPRSLQVSLKLTF